MNAESTTTARPDVTFPSGLPGFPEVRSFSVLHTELAQDPFAILRSNEVEGLEFVIVTEPLLFFPDYSPEVDETITGRIGLESADDAQMFVLLTVGEDVAHVTANLMGPIIVNRKNNLGVQAVLSNQGFDLRQPLFSDEVLATPSAAGEPAPTA